MSLWAQCVKSLEYELKQEDITTWIQPLKAFENSSELSLIAPNPSIAHWVQTNCLGHIKEQLSLIADHPVEVALSVLAQAPLGAAAGASKASNNQEDDKLSGDAEAAGKTAFLSFLNDAMRFDNFVVGPANRLAFSAAQAVAEMPGNNQANPLVLYSGVGLGKTHLLHAIGNEISKTHPDLEVVYLGSDKFMQDLVSSIQSQAMENFKKYYRSIDVLLVDDLHFLPDTDKTQEEFLHTFDHFLANGKQIVMTSNCFPGNLSNLKTPLRSRLASGLTQELAPPSVETRVAIVQNLALRGGLTVDEKTARYVAQHIDSNVRELEGAVRRLVSCALILGETPTEEMAKRELKDVFAAHLRQVSVEDIQKRVARFFGARVEDLLSPKRRREIVLARHTAMALAKELTPHSLPSLGDAFGRDHSTVLHGCRRIEELLRKDPGFEAKYQHLKTELRTGG